MKALVLAGGSILGAFQVGAIAQVLKSYQPDIIYGVSVGALNGGYLANFIGKNFPNAPNTSINWTAAGDDLKNFWLTNLTKPEQLVRQRSTVELIYQFAMNKFDGLTDTKPLDSLVKRLVLLENVQRCAVPVHVGYTSLDTGDFTLAPSQGNNDFIEDMLASAHLPLIMPIVRKTRQQRTSANMVNTTIESLTDGGVVNVSPLKCALANPAVTSVVAISCHAPSVLPAPPAKSWGNIIEQVSRVFDIMNREVLNDDLKRSSDINDEAQKQPNNVIPSGENAGKRYVPIVSIRPDADFAIDITSFTAENIKAMILAGENVAIREWGKQSGVLV
jgi:NTE family protein